MLANSLHKKRLGGIKLFLYFFLLRIVHIMLIQYCTFLTGIQKRSEKIRQRKKKEMRE